MAKLSLHIVDDYGQTRTLIGKNKIYGEIVFHNDSDQMLKVKFLDTESIQDKHGVPIPPAGIDVNPMSQKSVWCDSNAATGTKIKYTAQIEKTVLEDPIIIFER